MIAKFGRFTLDSGRRLLLDGDRVVTVPPKAFDLLELLIRRAPNVVPKETIASVVWQDEAPSWAPNGQFIMFNRIARGSGNSTLYAVNIDGGTARRLPTPLGGSDPSWSPLNN